MAFLAGLFFMVRGSGGSFDTVGPDHHRPRKSDLVWDPGPSKMKNGFSW